jgi:hypothetical protein
MLRVEASNLPTPIKIPRSRRLLPLPPGTRRRATLPAHPERDAKPSPRFAQRSFHGEERWSVKLELGNEEIAKLYGQGMARGAVVWRKGMVEWRPLLITPEFSDILRRTRITVPPSAPSSADIPPSGAAYDDPTLPPPGRLPYELLPRELLEDRVPISTIAPTAADVDVPPPPQRARRPIELAAVAFGAFVLAWIGHAALSSSPREDQQSLAAAAMAGPAQTPPAAAACEPANTPTSTARAEKTGPPAISVGDLPLAGGKSAVATTTHVATSSAPATHAASRAARSTPVAAPAAAAAPPASLPTAPSRSDLMAAMSQVARAASGCGERGDGPVRVVVSFASSGVARSIQVSGADLPASTRSCIIGAASRARVGAFSGDPVTVSKAL